MLSATLATLVCLCAARASPTDNHATYYPLKHSYANSKDLQTVLESIDERLRALDAVGAAQAQQARRLDAIQDKIERLETTVSIRLERAQLAAERLEHRLNMLQTNMQNTLESSSARLERSQARVAAIALNLTRNLEPHRHLLDKVSGAYGETWRRGIVLEGLTRDSLALVNVTRRELADGLRALARRQRDSRLSVADLDSAVSEAGATFTKRLNDQTHKLEKKVQAVLTAQEHFLDSCHRIQKDEPHIDNHVADVLEKLLDTFIEKTATTFHELQTIQNAIRTHDTKVARTLSARPTQLNDVTWRKMEALLRNTTASSARETEFQQLTEKFVDLTNRADAALQRLESHLIENNELVDKSEVTAAADRLIEKLNGIKSEEDDEEEPWSDESEIYDDGGGGQAMEQESDMIAEAEENDAATARPPHRRHLHKHPYDRGPHHTSTP